MVTASHFQPTMAQEHRRILFLKTDDYDVSNSAESHRIMFSTLRAQGHTVDERSWLHPHPKLGPLTLNDLKTYDAISFLVCYEYNKHVDEFYKFVMDCVVPAQKEGRMSIHNGVPLVLWNSNKIYLEELVRDVGITIPDTTFVETSGNAAEPDSIPHLQGFLSKHIASYPGNSNGPVVVKPSISASSKCTHKIPSQRCSSFSATEAEKSWTEVYTYARSLSCTTKVMIQSFEPGIKNGEYSIIFINDEYTHTVLKTPAQKDFRAGWEFGATTAIVDEDRVPTKGKEVGRKVIEYVKRKFGMENVGYLRLDGVLRDDGKFVVIEAEMIEPYIYFKEGAEGLKRFCELLTRKI